MPVAYVPDMRKTGTTYSGSGMSYGGYKTQARRGVHAETRSGKDRSAKLVIQAVHLEVSMIFT